MFTSEQVMAGHPDKVCDQISDAILDAYLAQDPAARCGLEVMATGSTVLLGGEVRSTARVDHEGIASQVIASLGYTEQWWPDLGDVRFIDAIVGQSPDIARGVDHGGATGAGDQGIMFGYANSTPAGTTLAHQWASTLALALTEARDPDWFGPDGKTQVTVDAEGNIHTVLVSVQHAPTVTPTQVRHHVQTVIAETLPRVPRRLLVNPTGRFVLGGPAADAGLTGRKIIADTYGGGARHGGGAFSGKDPSKMDRAGAYAARWLARSLVAYGYATECEVQLGYAIGVPEPLSIHVDTRGTGVAPGEQLATMIGDAVDLTPDGVAAALDLAGVRYLDTAAGGHFGRPVFPWETTVAALG